MKRMHQMTNLNARKESNSYPSFRKELKLPEPKTSEQIDKLAMNEKLTGEELVASLYENHA